MKRLTTCLAFLVWGILLVQVGAFAQVRFWHYKNVSDSLDAYVYRSYERDDVLLLKIGKRDYSEDGSYSLSFVGNAMATGFKDGDSTIELQLVVGPTFRGYDEPFPADLFDSLTLGTRWRYSAHWLGVYRDAKIVLRQFGLSQMTLEISRGDELTKVALRRKYFGHLRHLKTKPYSFALAETSPEYHCRFSRMPLHYRVQPIEFYFAGLNAFGFDELWSDSAAYEFARELITRLRSGDKKGVADMCAYPLHSSTLGKETQIRSRKELIRKFDRVFSPLLIRSLDSIYQEFPHAIVSTSGVGGFQLHLPDQSAAAKCINGDLRVVLVSNRPLDDFLRELRRGRRND